MKNIIAFTLSFLMLASQITAGGSNDTQVQVRNGPGGRDHLPRHRPQCGHETRQISGPGGKDHLPKHRGPCDRPM